MSGTERTVASTPAIANEKQDAVYSQHMGAEIGTNHTEIPKFPVWQWVLSLVGLYLGALLYGLDTTIAADVQTSIYEQFGEIESLGWVGLGFPLGSLASILLLGRLYDYFNVKLLLNSSIVLFEAGSALCGAAPSMNALIVGRVIAGIGGCGMYIGALTFLSRLGSPDKLFLYNALIGACWGTGAILGPVIGGAFSVSGATWRWAFYINLPLAGLFSPIYLFITPSSNPRPDEVARKKLAKIDWCGVILNTAFSVLLMSCLVFSGVALPWNSAAAIVLWIVFGALLVLYPLQQVYVIFTSTTNRIFPVHFLKSRELVLLFVATACSATINAVTLYNIPLLFAFTRGDTALQAAVRLLPFIVVFIFCVLLAGGTLPFVGRYALYYTLGGILTTIGSALMVTVRADTKPSLIYGYEVLMAAGSGLTFQNAYAVATAKVDANDRSNVIGFINTGQIGTTALSLAIASCLYQNLGIRFLRRSLSQFNFPAAFLRAALGGVGSAALTAAPPEAITITTSTIAYTISRVFGMNIAAGALMLCASLIMRQEKIKLSQLLAGG